MTRLLEFARALNPAVIGGVPRLHEKIAVALRNAPPAVVRAAFGSKLRLLVCASAQLAPAVGQFLTKAGLPLAEFFGMTDTAGVATGSDPTCARPGSVGKALPGTEIRIAEDGECSFVVRA
jgi:long-chain acyl-CoA synthetase